jgi:hypothetical protein
VLALEVTVTGLGVINTVTGTFTVLVVHPLLSTPATLYVVEAVGETVTTASVEVNPAGVDVHE